MRALVTGVAGFIGSQLAEQLILEGHDVVGVDCFTDYYDTDIKRSNLHALHGSDRFELRELDLRTADLHELVDGADLVFHQAAQPGVRQSWADFDTYCQQNVVALQRLLEAVKHTASIQRLVVASSSSVYGDADTYPCHESAPLTPRSPYGATKLTGEHLCRIYADSWSVPVVSLRYFTVYGPRQRPDMAMHRLCNSALFGDLFPMFGDGGARRDFTFVGDVVRANLCAGTADTAPGSVFNIAGGASATMTEVIAIIEELADGQVQLERRPDQAGDVRRTGGDITAARQVLGWEPTVGLRDGLARQVAWHATEMRGRFRAGAA